MIYRSLFALLQTSIRLFGQSSMLKRSNRIKDRCLKIQIIISKYYTSKFISILQLILSVLSNVSSTTKIHNNQPTKQNGRFEIHAIRLEASKNRDVGEDIARFDDFTLEIPTLPVVSRIFIARVREGSRQSGQGNTYRVPKSN